MRRLSGPNELNERRSEDVKSALIGMSESLARLNGVRVLESEIASVYEQPAVVLEGALHLELRSSYAVENS